MNELSNAFPSQSSRCPPDMLKPDPARRRLFAAPGFPGRGGATLFPGDYPEKCGIVAEGFDLRGLLIESRRPRRPPALVTDLS
jgi:hypothetical protein